MLPSLFIGDLLFARLFWWVACDSMRDAALLPPPVRIEYMLDMFAKPPYDFPLFVVDVQHDVQFVDNVLDLLLELPFRVDVQYAAV